MLDKIKKKLKEVALIAVLAWDVLTISDLPALDPADEILEDWCERAELIGWVSWIDLLQLEHMCGLPVIFSLCMKRETRPDLIRKECNDRNIFANDVRVAIKWFKDHK